RVPCLIYVPLDMGRRVARLQRGIDAAGARPERPSTLSAEASPWSLELFMEVTKPVPGARMATLSGTFTTKLYEGPFHHAGKWVAGSERQVVSADRSGARSRRARSSSARASSSVTGSKSSYQLPTAPRATGAERQTTSSA